MEHPLAGRSFAEATIFEWGYPMGYRQSEVRDLTFRIAPMWSGKLRLIAEGVFKGKRKMQLFEPTRLVAIKGWGHPELEVMMPGTSETGYKTFTARFPFPSTDEWSAFLDEYLRGLGPEREVIFDYRLKGATDLLGTPPSDRQAPQSELDPASPAPTTDGTRDLREGAVREVILDLYERNPVARQRCLDHYGYTCQACLVDMEITYGELGREYVHVHHRVPLADIGEDYEVDPIADLVPVCPNCHAMLHRPERVLTIDELRAIVQSQRKRVLSED